MQDELQQAREDLHRTQQDLLQEKSISQQLQADLHKSRFDIVEQKQRNEELLRMGTSLTMAWALSLADETCRSFTGLPLAGLKLLLALCESCGMARAFAPQRFYQTKPGSKSKAEVQAMTQASAFNTILPPLAAPHPSLTWQDRILLFLVHIKCDLGERQLAAFFHLDQPQVSSTIDIVATLLERILDQSVGKPRVVPPQERLKCFGLDTPFANVTHIADCTLIRVNKPRNHVLQQLLYSTYLPGHKLKAFVSMGPDGYPNYVSALYASSASDHDIALEDGFYQVLVPGDEVMFDKGGAAMLPSVASRGAKLITPSFVSNGYLTLGEYSHSRLVSSARVHIERLNERIKRFRWLDGVISTPAFDNVSVIWRVCVWLTNFMEPPCKDGGSGLPHNRGTTSSDEPSHSVSMTSEEVTDGAGGAAGADAGFGGAAAASASPASVAPTMDDLKSMFQIHIAVTDGDEDRNFDPVDADSDVDVH